MSKSAERRDEVEWLFLQAHLDGMLGPEEAELAELLLAAQPELRARLADLAEQDQALRRLFAVAETRLSAPPRPVPRPLPAPRAVTGPARTRRFTGRFLRPLAGGAAAGLLAAGILLWPLPQASPPAQPLGWRMTAAIYVELFSERTLTVPQLSARTLAEGLRDAGAAVGRDLSVLAKAPGNLAMRRAETLQFGGAPLAQVAYTDDAGRVFALCVFRQSQPVDAEVAASPLRSLAGATWSEGGFAYLLLGRSDQPALNELARRFAALL